MKNKLKVTLVIMVMILVITLSGCSTSYSEIIEVDEENGITYTFTKKTLIVTQKTENIDTIYTYYIESKLEKNTHITYYFEYYSINYDKATEEYKFN